MDGFACVESLSWTYQNLTLDAARELGCCEDVREFRVPAGGTFTDDRSNSWQCRDENRLPHEI